MAIHSIDINLHFFADSDLSVSYHLSSRLSRERAELAHPRCHLHAVLPNSFSPRSYRVPDRHHSAIPVTGPLVG